jgi:lipid-A-disaccharide synthase
MVRKSFMLIAGEPSGDLLAAELVPHLRARVTDIESEPSPAWQPIHASLEPVFYGAGGPHMRTAGVDLLLDMTQHSVVGLWEVIKRYAHFLRVFRQLMNLAIAREPHAIVCVDFSGFNLRFAHAIRRQVRSLRGTFGNWDPILVQYVSPQVWASRPERARLLAEDDDLLLTILPFEKEWYAQRAPQLHVEFVGHPIIDRHAAAVRREAGNFNAAAPRLLLLPGSRVGELKQHLPVLLGALAKLRSSKPALQATMVLPNETLTEAARSFGLPTGLDIQTGKIATELARADLAIASTGTVMLECAYFGVPTVALYKTSGLTYSIAKRLVQVRFLAMPNLLANEEVFPEFIQDAATAENLARAALELLDHPQRRQQVQSKLTRIVQSLGPPGACVRAANAIVDLLESRPSPIRAALT